MATVSFHQQMSPITLLIELYYTIKNIETEPINLYLEPIKNVA
jgi:hypothetical protein